MYYRYKSKERRIPFLKIIFVLGTLSFLVWGMYTHRERLMFWKMSERKIASILSNGNDGESRDAKIERLRLLEKNSLKNCEKNPYGITSNYTCATILFGIGEALSDLDFSKYCMSAGERQYSAESLSCFYRAIRLIRKAAAVDETRAVPDDVMIKLAYMYYITAYFDINEIARLTEDIAIPQQLSDVNERRFYSFLLIRKGAVDEGISFLKQYGQINEFADRSFLAAMYADAGQYTDAIDLYLELQKESPDAGSRRRISRSLGDLFFHQMLYDEALAQYSALYTEMPDDLQLKKAIGETYLAMGDRQKAEEYLSQEVTVR